VLVRAQVTFQGGSGLPEDRFINTFHFFDATWPDLATAAAAIHPALTDFYETAYPTVAIGGIMSPYAARAYEIRYYDLGAPTPRVPVILTSTLPAVIASPALPEEVAIVASFHGLPPVTGSTRGRVYLGPLNSAAVTPGTTTTPTRVNAGVAQAVADAMEALSAALVGWIVLSSTYGLQTDVLGGFVNNDLDTQRRRGPDADSRIIWP
jgi:hypothetical protein